MVSTTILKANNAIIKNTNNKIKTFIKASSITLCILLSMAAVADISPYLGADVGIKNVGFKNGFGHNLFKGSHKMGRAFVGFKLSINLNLEASVEKTLGSSKKGNNKVKFFNIGTSLVHNYILPSCENLIWLNGVGIKQIKVNLNAPLNNGAISVNKSKLVITALTGIEYMFNEYVGMRTLLSYEHTSKLKTIDNNVAIKLRNSLGMSSGVVVRI
jgi:hypothetical protein